jgi:hypothetical protein
MVFFAFPEDARWDDEGSAVEFTVQLGESFSGCSISHPRRSDAWTLSIFSALGSSLQSSES